MLAISSRGIWVNPCSVCVYYQCTRRYSSTVQYDIGTTADTSDFIQNWVSLR